MTNAVQSPDGEFNRYVNSIMNNIANSQGTELAMSIGIYENSELFNPLQDILVGKIAGSNKRNKAKTQHEKLKEHSTAYEMKYDAFVKAKLETKQGGNLTGIARANMLNYRAAINAVRAMFDRAVTSAYFLQHLKATIKKHDSKVVHVIINKTTTFLYGNSDTTLNAGETVIWSRKDLYELAKAFVKQSIAGIAPSRTKTLVPKTNNITAIISGTKALGESILAIDTVSRDEIISSDEFDSALISMLRARFVSDGVLDIKDVERFIRNNALDFSIDSQVGAKGRMKVV